MKKNVAAILLSVLAFILVLGSVLVIFVDQYKKKTATPVQEEAPEIRTFADWTDHSALGALPAMLVEGTHISKAFDVGAGRYNLDVTGTSVEDYRAYIKTLEAAGYAKYVDNGEEGINGEVFQTTLTKENVTVEVTYIQNIEKTYISAGEDEVLSGHLIYDESYVAGNKEGAKTKVHMVELAIQGNSFVIEMKNGHFLVSDGGTAGELPYLLDYLDSLTPGEEKPIVEGWFITHAHNDHADALGAFVKSPEYAERLYVEGVYFNEPGDPAYAKNPGVQQVSQGVMWAATVLQTTNGESPEVYRPQTGQKYYFNDIVIDIVMGQEQVYPANYVADINESSTICMLHIDGQKVLLMGDAGMGLMKCIMRSYSREYLDVEAMSAVHHALDTWNTFTDYCTVKVALINALKFDDTNSSVVYLRDQVSECLLYVDGTTILTFPYVAGSAKQLAPTVPNRPKTTD